MLRNFTNEEYIKGFYPQLAYLLWRAETDYSKQREKAEQIVINSLIAKGENLKAIMPELVLNKQGTTITATTTGSSFADIINRQRLVIETLEFTGTSVTITLQGSSDNSGTSSVWSDITSIDVTPTTDTTQSILFTQSYNQYRLKTTIDGSSTIDYKGYLVETVFDLLFAYKWLEIIFRESKKNNEDQFAMAEQDCITQYQDVWESARYYMGTAGNNIITQMTTTNIEMSR